MAEPIRKATAGAGRRAGAHPAPGALLACCRERPDESRGPDGMEKDGPNIRIVRHAKVDEQNGPEALLGQHLVNELDADGAFAYGGGDALDASGADVSDCEHTGLVRLEEEWRAAVRPA